MSFILLQSTDDSPCMYFRMDIGGLQDAAKARREKLMAMRAKV